MIPKKLHPLGLFGLFVVSVVPALADWKDDVGFTRLQAIAAGELPTAPSNGYTHCEALDLSSNFIPDTASTNYTGRTFVLKSGASGTSGHADTVASRFYGNTTSMLSGSATVDLYNANGWIGTGFLFTGYIYEGTSIPYPPAIESRAIQNHSWIATSASSATEVNQRLDFAINRDGFVSVVGVNNNNSTLLPALLCQSYHTISVGLVNGAHSAGFTTVDGTGRIKPEIVAPDSLTSFATPMVSGAAGILIEKLQTVPYLISGADKPRVVKALLMGSARKDAVASWENTSTRPLDLRYGAGALNVYHAYSTLRSGRMSASTSSSVAERAWAAESISSAAVKTYYFTVPAGASTPFCAALTWHRAIPTLGLAPTLANLNLRLHNAIGFSVGSQIAQSASTVDNVEMVYQSALPPGDYVLVVESLSATSTPYALAWHSLPFVGCSATGSLAKESDGQTGTITLTRTGDTTLPLFVPLTIGGTAIPGTHYQALPSSVTFAAGASSLDLTITPISDSVPQGDRTVTVALASDFASVRNPAQVATVTIQDKPSDAWRFSEFTESELSNPAVSGLTADPDNDGILNLLEFAFGGEPKISDNAILPDSAVSSDYPAISFRQRAGGSGLVGVNYVAAGLSYVVEVSSTLAGESWNSGSDDVEVVGTPINNGDGTETVVVRSKVPLGTTPRQFLRVRVQSTP